MPRGPAAYSGVSLQATYMKSLGNGVAVTSLSGTLGEPDVYKIPVTAGYDELEFEIWGGTGNCDLYVRALSVPTPTNFGYTPAWLGTTETVTVSSPASGTWYVMLRGIAATPGLSLGPRTAPPAAARSPFVVRALARLLVLTDSLKAALQTWASWPRPTAGRTDVLLEATGVGPARCRLAVGLRRWHGGLPAMRRSTPMPRRAPIP